MNKKLYFFTNNAIDTYKFDEINKMDTYRLMLMADIVVFGYHIVKNRYRHRIVKDRYGKSRKITNPKLIEMMLNFNGIIIPR